MSENVNQTDGEMSVEKAFERLNVLVDRLGEQDLTLEDSLAFYEEGIKLVKFCSDELDRVEKKVLKLRQDGQIDEF